VPSPLTLIRRDWTLFFVGFRSWRKRARWAWHKLNAAPSYRVQERKLVIVDSEAELVRDGQHARPADRRCKTGGANRRQLSQRLHPVCAGESYSPPGANRNRKFVDSLLEGDGFELFVPPRVR
jgi:hypothetical protein